jgi:hypothetical protein
VSLDIAIEELHTRRREESEAERDGSWEAWCAMKSTRGYRRRRIGWSRSKMKEWLRIAEEHLSMRQAA